MTKTGGGRGTNQYQVQGVSQASRQSTAVLDDLGAPPPEDDGWADRQDEQRALWAVARNPHTTPEILAALADAGYTRVSEAVARHPSTPPVVLVRLASDGNTTIRLGVADNPSTPPEIQDILACDEVPEIRRAVARCAMTRAG